jgi:two-component system, NarL family, nitrate/nitrite response regulator NarL
MVLGVRTPIIRRCGVRACRRAVRCKDRREARAVVRAHDGIGDVMAGALVVDDDGFIRALVASLVAGLGYDPVSETASAAHAMRCAHERPPAVAVLDLDLGEGPTGIDLAHGLRRLIPTLPIVMLTSYSDPLHAGLRRELPPGIPYVVKSETSTADAITSAIALAQEGVAPLREPADSLTLSAGQWETFRLVAAGYSNPEIARRRHLTDDAVNKSVSRLISSLGLEVSKDENIRVLIAREYFRQTGTVSERRD